MQTLDPKLLAERNAKLLALGLCPPWWRPFARRRWVRRYAAILAMDVTAARALLRRLYPAEHVVVVAQQEHPMLGAIARYRPEKP